jgi:hypothetical protein
MKIILVIQSLIIIVGAIYIFTLNSNESAMDTSEVTEMLPPPPPPPPPADLVDAAIEATAQPTTMPPNDAQMEWPIPDENLEVR